MLGDILHGLFQFKGNWGLVFKTSNTQSCLNKIFKTFLIEDFFHLPPVLMTPVVHLEMRISPGIIEKKFETAILGYSGAWGKLIYEKP
jgi:hypothetical protein